MRSKSFCKYNSKIHTRYVLCGEGRDDGERLCVFHMLNCQHKSFTCSAAGGLSRVWSYRGGIKPALKTARVELDGITRVETLRRGKGRCGKMKSMNERGLRGI